MHKTGEWGQKNQVTINTSLVKRKWRSLPNLWWTWRVCANFHVLLSWSNVWDKTPSWLTLLTRYVFKVLSSPGPFNTKQPLSWKAFVSCRLKECNKITSANTLCWCWQAMVDQLWQQTPSDCQDVLLKITRQVRAACTMNRNVHFSITFHCKGQHLQPCITAYPDISTCVYAIT